MTFVDTDELQVIKKSTLTKGKTSPAAYPNNGALCINESGLYKLIMRSNKPSAKRFQDWVTRDVLPAIRKDGAYIMGEEKVASGELSEEEFILKAWEMLAGKVERLKSHECQIVSQVIF